MKGRGGEGGGGRGGQGGGREGGGEGGRRSRRRGIEAGGEDTKTEKITAPLGCNTFPWCRGSGWVGGLSGYTTRINTPTSLESCYHSDS